MNGNERRLNNLKCHLVGGNVWEKDYLNYIN